MSDSDKVLLQASQAWQTIQKISEKLPSVLPESEAVEVVDGVRDRATEMLALLDRCNGECSRGQLVELTELVERRRAIESLGRTLRSIQTPPPAPQRSRSKMLANGTDAD